MFANEIHFHYPSDPASPQKGDDIENRKKEIAELRSELAAVKAEFKEKNERLSRLLLAFVELKDTPCPIYSDYYFSDFIRDASEYASFSDLTELRNDTTPKP